MEAAFLMHRPLAHDYICHVEQFRPHHPRAHGTSRHKPSMVVAILHLLVWLSQWLSHLLVRVCHWLSSLPADLSVPEARQGACPVVLQLQVHGQVVA